jgi:hypothetical protein
VQNVEKNASGTRNLSIARNLTSRKSWKNMSTTMKILKILKYFKYLRDQTAMFEFYHRQDARDFMEISKLMDEV